jgi:hypothetical protein
MEQLKHNHSRKTNIKLWISPFFSEDFEDKETAVWDSIANQKETHS